MPLVRTITEGDTVRVVTKNGLVSCTCCDGCSPDYTAIYVRAYYGEPEEIEYFTLEGSLNSGYFTAPGTDNFLVWDEGLAEWLFSSFSYGNFSGGFDRCLPNGLFGEVEFSFEPWV